MKIAHVITSVAADRGGPSHSVPALVAAQVELGHDARLVTLDDTPTWREAVRDVDIVHQHGIWEWSLAQLDRELLRRGVPYCVSLRGTLDAWSRRQKQLKKRLAWALYQRGLLMRARAIFALTEQEVEEARAWLPHPRYVIAPNGANAPEAMPSAELFRRQYPGILNGAAPPAGAAQAVAEESERPELLLFMARLHHKKGLQLLPEILERVRREFPHARLAIAGEAREDQRRHVEAMRAELARRGLLSCVVETGMLGGELKWSALAAADVFVLPSHEEGMPMAVLEALAAGVPCVLSEGCRLRIVEERGAGRVVALDPERLAEGVVAVLRDRETAARAARDLAAGEFTWRNAAERTLAGYGATT